MDTSTGNSACDKCHYNSRLVLIVIPGGNFVKGGKKEK